MGTMAMSRRGRPACGCGGRAVAPGQKRMRSMLRGSFMILIRELTQARLHGYRLARPGDALYARLAPSRRAC